MSRTILRIAAALIDDDGGRLLFVRKAGTRWFMQAGGKIEPGERPDDALCRELAEELGVAVTPSMLRHLARLTCPAANEADHDVDAELFHLRLTDRPCASAEIAEIVWASPADASGLPLAPLSRDHVLPIAAMLSADVIDPSGVRNPDRR